MKIEIKQVTFKSLEEVAYGTRQIAYFVEKPENKVTINFTVQTEVLKLDGYFEMNEKDYVENILNLKQIIKDNLK